ncbi:MAG: DsbA family oxidoreductase [Pseudomonadota bacterium]
MTDPVRIDIVSDVVCPWCVVGFRQLQEALRSHDDPVEIHWHPFELNPDMPPEGENLRDHIMRKYGSSTADSAAARARLTEIGDKLGFAFRFSEDSRIYNTFAAHQLIHWARDQGSGGAVKAVLFDAYFTEGRNVSDPAVLYEIAAAAGLDALAAKKMLDEGSVAQAVRAHERFWTERGVRGVPAMIFDQKYLVTGAQGIDGYAHVLREVQGNRAA